jgi:hypothetical protein
VTLVATAGVLAAHWLSGDRVQRGQVGHVAARHSCDGGWGQAQLSGQVERATPGLLAQPQDPCFGRGGQAGWAEVWAGGAVGQAGHAFGVVAGQPCVDRGAGDAELFGDPGGGQPAW